MAKAQITKKWWAANKPKKLKVSNKSKFEPALTAYETAKDAALKSPTDVGPFKTWLQKLEALSGELALLQKDNKGEKTAKVVLDDYESQLTSAKGEITKAIDSVENFHGIKDFDSYIKRFNDAAIKVENHAKTLLAERGQIEKLWKFIAGNNPGQDKLDRFQVMDNLKKNAEGYLKLANAAYSEPGGPSESKAGEVVERMGKVLLAAEKDVKDIGQIYEAAKSKINGIDPDFANKLAGKVDPDANYQNLDLVKEEDPYQNIGEVAARLRDEEDDVERKKGRDEAKMARKLLNEMVREVAKAKDTKARVMIMKRYNIPPNDIKAILTPQDQFVDNLKNYVIEKSREALQ